MKNQVMKCLKRAFAVALATSMVVGMGMVASAATYDENQVGSVAYVGGFNNYKTLMDANQAPEVPAKLNTGTGYLFAGWFERMDGNKYRPLAAANEVQTGGNVVAKFIPAQLLSVKCQANSNATLKSDSASLKVFTCLDSLNYSQVGFKVKTINLSNDGKTFGNIKTEKFVESDTVYRELKVKVGSKTTIYKAEEAFGEGIGAKYFATSWIRNIAKENYSNIVSVQPYLKTLDGTQVLGLEKYVHVEDAFATNDGYRWVNVPINVRNTKEVAAGVLTLTNNKNWTCEQIECGRLFQEMDYAAQAGSAKLVGNLSNMNQDVAKNAIYANVRFKVHVSELSEENTQYSFGVKDVDFANTKEEAFADSKFPVWDVAFSVMK